MTNAAPTLDLVSCENEPIRIPGGIQPHGAVLVIDAERHTIVQASANAARMLGSTLTTLINQPAAQVVGVDHYAKVTETLARLRDSESAPLKVDSWRLKDGTLVDCIAHRRDATMLLEFERVEPPELAIDELPAQIVDFVTALEDSSNVHELCRLVSEQVRQLIGFDRVLVYQFDRDWNGIVVGEARNERLPSYFDLRFPASDIPAQARELYRVNRSRIIPNVDYTPVPIEPVRNPLTGLPIDLSFSTLRSVSPVHLEYMRNMGTPASTSFSILRNGQLWGLISCHNSEPRMVRFGVRRACELIAQTFSLQIASLEAREAAERRVRLNETRSRLLNTMAVTARFEDALVANPDELLASTHATGAAIVVQDAVHCVGQTPDEAAIRALVAWLAGVKRHETYNTHHLAHEFASATAYADIASGILAISISRFQSSYLIWFRPEVARTVTWAGDPNKAKTAGPYEAKLHPRVSFEAWKETVRGRALPWHPAELEAAETLRGDIVGIVLRKAEELAAVSQELERSNKELEAFSYSVSHDLRAPFRHIVGYSELVQDLEAKNLSERGKRYVQTVIEAGRTAGRLIDNLLLFSQMGRNGLRCMEIDMNRLFAEVRAEVTAADAGGRSIDWQSENLPPAWGDPNMMRLVVRNLISNAVKYTRGRETAHIRVSATHGDRGTTYRVSDDGVGFDMAYVDKLFGVFQRLHRIEEFEGTGIGLANVRRIVHRHGGRTWAEGEVGRGASFYFELPKQVVDSES